MAVAASDGVAQLSLLELFEIMLALEKARTYTAAIAHQMGSQKETKQTSFQFMLRGT